MITIGNYQEESQRKNGWFIGHFMDESRRSENIEIKYWKFPIGETGHKKKKQKTATEITLILKGEAKGQIEGEEVTLQEGQYFMIPPGVISNFPKIVLKDIVGLTIKSPSIKNDTVKIEG